MFMPNVPRQAVDVVPEVRRRRHHDTRQEGHARRCLHGIEHHRAHARVIAPDERNSEVTDLVLLSLTILFHIAMLQKIK